MENRERTGARDSKVVRSGKRRIRCWRKTRAPGEIGRSGEEVSRRQRYPPPARSSDYRIQRPLHAAQIYLLLLKRVHVTIYTPTFLSILVNLRKARY